MKLSIRNLLFLNHTNDLNIGIRNNINRNMKSSFISAKYNNLSVKNEISFERGRQLIANKELVNNMTKIKGKGIRDIKVVNNVLTLEKGEYYRVKSKSGISTILTSGNKGNVYMPVDDLNLGKDFQLATSDWKEVSLNQEFFTYLSDETAFSIRMRFSDSEVNQKMDELGFKPGWIEYKNADKHNKFYLLDSGSLYPEHQVEAIRKGFNHSNWFKDGYTKESKFIVDGKEYKLDDQGHLNIPKGEAFLMEKIKIIK